MNRRPEHVAGLAGKREVIGQAGTCRHIRVNEDMTHGQPGLITRQPDAAQRRLCLDHLEIDPRFCRRPGIFRRVLVLILYRRRAERPLKARAHRSDGASPIRHYLPLISIAGCLTSQSWRAFSDMRRPGRSRREKAAKACTPPNRTGMNVNLTATRLP